MNFIINFIELHFLTISIFLFTISLFLIFSIFKEWMIITKLTNFYILNAVTIAVLIEKFKIPIEKNLKITSNSLIKIHIYFTIFLVLIICILMVIENERFINKIKKMWFDFTSFFTLRLSYLPHIAFKLTKLIQ